MVPAGVVTVLMLGFVGCILFGMRDCRQTTPPVVPTLAQLAPQTNLVVVTPTPLPATNTTPAIKREVDALGEANANWARYMALIGSADFDSASNVLQTITARLSTSELQERFWDSAIPKSARGTLGLFRMCLLCAQGQCWRCQGEGACAACSGSGLCATCKGVSAKFSRCMECRCKRCAATGRCTACSGQALVRCDSCAGTGSTSIAVHVPCASCGGDGTRSGLQRASGAASQTRCLTCRGAGQREVSQYRTCPVCTGKGRVPCPACSGNGRCPACTGQGRNTPCAACGSTGQLRHECQTCKGAGRCQECKGTKSCATCSGAGSCPKCAGHGLTEHLQLPVDRRWLSQARGYVVSDARTGARLASGYSEGPQTITVRDRQLTFTVPTNTLLWISTELNFARARDILTTP